MVRSRQRTLLLGWRLAATALVASPAILSGRDVKMTPDIQLYQFVHEGDGIAVTRISRVDIKTSPNGGQEHVTLDLRVESDLTHPGRQATYSYQFDRPSYVGSRLKFPDPVWGRVTIRIGAEVLLVTPPAPAKADTQNPVYAEDIPGPDDPVLHSIRDVLNAELARQADTERFDRRLRWLASGDMVHKLFGGESLAKQGFPSEQESRLMQAFARAFVAERDEYTAVTLGTWLWENLYPRATSDDGRIVIVNATIAAASSELPSVRTFVIDRLSGCDPKLLSRPGVQPSRDAISQLEERRAAEQHAGVKESLARIIQALRR